VSPSPRPLHGGRPDPLPAGPDQESVWEYPRPPALVRSTRLVEVRSPDGAALLARTDRARRVLETSHPPTWYLPRADVADGVLVRSAAPATTCEWKGRATSWDVVLEGGGRLEAAAWSYEAPTPRFADLAGAIAFAPAQVVATVDGERVRAQEGGFYGGWVTDDVVGPFKGGPGTWGW